MKKIAIDLTWVRHNKVGGTESCVRNLLSGFAQINPKDWIIILLLSKDNADSFKKYAEYSCFILDVCNVNSDNQKERVIWQNTKMGRHLKKLGIKLCLEPVYGKPFIGTKEIDFITTIHDLQAIHYPQYFSKGRVSWMKMSWKNSVRSSKKIVAISEYVKSDIEMHYSKAKGKTVVIYDAIHIDASEVSDTSLLKKLGVEPQKYYYTVSSLFLHKNLKTLVLSIAELKKNHSKVFFPLVVSGIGGRKRDELDKLIEEYNIKNDIIFTSFVSNDERNMLYKNSRVFLFPSIFEGFGMPPLEAAYLDVPVLTTRCTSIEEVTGGLLNYVDNPLDAKSWANSLENEIKKPDFAQFVKIMSRYDQSVVANEYIKLFDEMVGE